MPRPAGRSVQAMKNLCDMPGQSIRRLRRISVALFSEESAGFGLASVRRAVPFAVPPVSPRRA